MVSRVGKLVVVAIPLEEGVVSEHRVLLGVVDRPW